MQSQELDWWKNFINSSHNEHEDTRDMCSGLEVPKFLFEDFKKSLSLLCENEFYDIESQTNRIFLKRGVPLNEITYSNLRNVTSPVIIGRGTPSPSNRDPYDQEIENPERSPKIRLVYARPGQGLWRFSVPGCRAQADKKCPPNSKSSYITTLKGLKKGNLKDLNRADIQVSCTCPFFKWGGPEYNAKAGNYQYQSPAGTASDPVVRDPNRVNKVRKHVIAVFGILDKFPFYMEYK